MLHVTRLTDRTGSYYLADLASELGPARHPAGGPEGLDLASELGPARRPAGGPEGLDLVPARPGWWTGAGAAGLGLAGPVEDRDLAAVLSGRSPATGRPLVARHGTTCGYDLTFTAPKSASVLFALGQSEVAREVLSAHAGAVEATMGYVARHAAAVRRRSGEERRSEPVGGVVGAAFTHGVSRALDPHLHTHVVVANLGHGPDGRWTALDGRGLFAHVPAAGHLYDAQLRHELSARLGVEWTVRRRGSYEVAGIDPAVLGGFSTRQAEIRSHLAEWSPRRRAPGVHAAIGDAAGRPRSDSGPATDRLPGAGGRGAGRASWRATRVAWAATRDPKAPPPAPGDLARRWSAQAAALGLAPDDLRLTLDRSPRSPLGNTAGGPRAPEEPAIAGHPGGPGGTAGHGAGGPRAPEEPAIAGRRSGHPGGPGGTAGHGAGGPRAPEEPAIAGRRSGHPGGPGDTAGHGAGGPRAPEEPAIAGRRSGGPGGPGDSIDEHRFAARLVVSPHAAAARRDVVGAWAGALAKGAPVADVERCADLLVAWGGAVGVGEPRRALAGIVPAPHQLRALGPRPASPGSLGVWLEAATAMARYRSRWGVTDPVRALGVEGSGRELAAMGARQLADHLATSRQLADARRQLGRAAGRDAEPPYLSLGRG